MYLLGPARVAFLLDVIDCSLPIFQWDSLSCAINVAWLALGPSNVCCDHLYLSCCHIFVKILWIWIWISNYTHVKYGDAITLPWSDFNGDLVKPPLKLGNGWSIDRSRYYYSHLVAARGCGSRKPRVRVVWTNMTKECEVKCKYHWDIVQNKYENLMILHIRIIRGEDLFSMGIYRLTKTKIYFTVCISMYVKSSVPACTWRILQRPLTVTRWLWQREIGLLYLI